MLLSIFFSLLQLEKPIMAQGNVELWLGRLLDGVLSSVHAVIKNAVVNIQDPNFDFLEFLNTFPAQVYACIYTQYRDPSSPSVYILLVT